MKKKVEIYMVTLFTTNSCSSCKKAKKWLENYQIPYVEKNMYVEQITKEDLISILEHTENGFEDILSTRSKVLADSKLNVDNMKMSELIEFIIENPSVLRRPILIERDKMQIGYNEEEIRCFIPKEVRERLYPNGNALRNCLYVVNSESNEDYADEEFRLNT